MLDLHCRREYGSTLVDRLLDVVPRDKNGNLSAIPGVWHEETRTTSDVSHEEAAMKLKAKAVVVVLGSLTFLGCAGINQANKGESKTTPAVQMGKTKSVTDLKMAAEKGDAVAQFNLGVCYDEGQSVSQDDTEAVKWYRKAADQGYAAAQYNLALCYDKGDGVTKDDAEAVKWYRKAAALGDVNAQYNLALCYDEGQGVPNDTQAAYGWLLLASAAGDKEAAKALKVVEGKLSRPQIREARKWAKRWKAVTSQPVKADQ